MEMQIFQAAVSEWLVQCFGENIADDKIERIDRFMEEALELAQSLNYDRDRAHALVDYVFDRNIGSPHQELGGTMLTLAALSRTHRLNMGCAAADELKRVCEPKTMEKIRRKQAAKPTGSALPL